MSERGVRERIDFSTEEFALACKTTQRRIGGMFYRARHRKLRTAKGTRRSTCGMIYGPNRIDWLVDYAVREVRADGGPLKTHKRVIVRRILTGMVMDGTIYWEHGTWKIDVDYMEACRIESRELSRKARDRKQREKANGGYVPSVRRMRRTMPVST